MEDLSKINDKTLDLVGLIQKVYLKRSFILLSTIFFGITSSIYSLFIPNRYTAKVISIQNETGTPKQGGISSLAAFAGIDLSDANKNKISYSVYPKIIESTSYKNLLLKHCFYDESGNFKSLASHLGFTKDNNDSMPCNMNDSIKYLSLEKSGYGNKDYFDQGLDVDYPLKNYFPILSKTLSIDYESTSGVITLGFTHKDRLLASNVVNYAQELLQQTIINLQNKPARDYLEFSKKMYLEQRILYQSLLDSIARLTQSNINNSSKIFDNRVDLLEDELEVSLSVLMELAKDVESAKLQVRRDTPVFTSLDSNTFPLNRESPNRTKIVLMSTIFGLALSLIFVLFRNDVWRIWLIIKQQS